MSISLTFSYHTLLLCISLILYLFTHSIFVSLYLSFPISASISYSLKQSLISLLLYLYLSYSSSISLTLPLSLLLVLYLSYSTSIFNSISYCTSIFTSIYFSLTHSHYVCVSHAAFQAYTCFPHSHTLPQRAYLSRWGHTLSLCFPPPSLSLSPTLFSNFFLNRSHIFSLARHTFLFKPSSPFHGASELRVCGHYRMDVYCEE